MATQVPAAPAGKVRWNIEPVGVPAGVRHRHHGSRWKHRCDGDIFSRSLVWTCPDLAHEPHPGVIFLMLPSSRPYEWEYVMKKCWRSWPHMMWKLSPHSSLWPINAPEPPRAVHGTQPHKAELPSREAREPSPGTERRKRRRPRLPEVAVHRSSGRSRDRRLGRSQQTPTAEEG
jgi:hypothetical protein